MNQRLSRKEIKRDEFMESLGGAVEWVRENSRSLIGAALAILIAMVLGAAYFAYSQGRAEKADEALWQALRVFQAPLDAVAANPEDEVTPSFADAAERARRAQELFEAVRQDFGRTEAARVATVYLGQIAAQEGDMEGAKVYWQEFITKSSDHALAIEARVNLMALDRAAGRGDELVTEIRAMLSGPDAGLPPDLLWYQLALTLEELGRQGEANEAFQRIVDEYPQSAYAPAARERTGGGPTPLFGT